jgi:transcription factor-like protein
MGLHNCIYPTAPQSATENRRDELSIPSSSSSFLSPSPSTSSYSEGSLSFRASAVAIPVLVERERCANATDVPEEFSDTDLYHHYLQHTSRTLTHYQRHQSAIQIGMPTLALQNKTVYHSLLAASAACICVDMISKENPPETSRISRILMTGYRHYNLACEQMRESISRSDSSELETLLASALVLVPFATASQQVNHWVSTRSEIQDSNKLLSITPRDVIIIMRGIQTTIHTLECGSLNSTLKQSLGEDTAFGSSSVLPEVNTGRAVSVPSRTHVMFSILVATSQGAFSKLQKNLESAFLYRSNESGDSLSACSAAFKILKGIRSNAFSTPDLSSAPSVESRIEESSEPKSVFSLQIAPWLRSYVATPAIPLPTEPLTRFFLSFLVSVPQAYLDLVLPLLDQRLENPIGPTLDDTSVELTMEQALALDIYAHWSVLIILLEKEAWYIGDLPVVTLGGMINRYGDNFVSKLWPENGTGQEFWWPRSMLNIFREIKRYQERG